MLEIPTGSRDVVTFEMGIGPEVVVGFKVTGSHVDMISLLEPQERCRGLSCRISFCDDAHSNEIIDVIASWLEDYCECRQSRVDIPLRLPTLTPFAENVLKILQKVPWGNSVSYGELASLAGSPLASRAVGSVCHKNSFPLIIPCHRVLAKERGLGGFACGLEVKKRLLYFENILFGTELA